MRIAPDPLTSPEVAAFLEAHLDQMRATSPPESVHALDLDGLRAPGTRFWSAYDGGELVGCVALALVDPEREPGHGELKSMRTAPDRVREGIAGRLLRHVLDEARGAGLTRVSLETGTQEFFAPARALYARHGFVECAPFGRYRPDPFSVFLTREP